MERFKDVLEEQDRSNTLRATENELRLRRRGRQEEIGFAEDAPLVYSLLAMSFWFSADSGRFLHIPIDIEESGQEIHPRVDIGPSNTRALFCDHLVNEPVQMTVAGRYADAYCRLETAKMWGIDLSRFQQRLDEIAAEAPPPNPKPCRASIEPLPEDFPLPPSPKLDPTSAQEIKEEYYRTSRAPFMGNGMGFEEHLSQGMVKMS